MNGRSLQYQSFIRVGFGFPFRYNVRNKRKNVRLVKELFVSAITSLVRHYSKRIKKILANHWLGLTPALELYTYLPCVGKNYEFFWNLICSPSRA